MMRVAIYARYSSDSQKAASIEDQVRVCQERLARDDWYLAQTYVDRAISGASLLRPGIQALIADAMAAKFDIVVAEALDRISRDQEDVAGFYKRMSFAGVRIITLSEGEINDLHVGLKGTMNALFLKDLADKTRRGLRGRVENGKSGGGNSYGYAVVHSPLSDGTIARGDRRIDEAQAEIVRRIFRDYAVGKSPRRIAFELNAEGVPCPSGADWGPSKINGNSARGTGILNNELYVGQLVWNRLRYAKNPDSGKRVSRLNPPEQWVRQQVEHCRIVSDELWQSVKGRQACVSRATRPDKAKPHRFWSAQRPKTLLSGLTRCGACGGAYTKISATLLGCATARNKGTCSNRQNVRLDRLEAQILESLRDQLLAPDLYKAFAEVFYAEINRLRMNEGAHITVAQRELAQIGRKLGQLVAAIADGGPAKALMVEVHRLEARQGELEAQIAAYDAPPKPLIHPALPELYRRKVSELSTSLAIPHSRTRQRASYVR